MLLGKIYIQRKDTVAPFQYFCNSLTNVAQTQSAKGLSFDCSPCDDRMQTTWALPNASNCRVEGFTFKAIRPLPMVTAKDQWPTGKEYCNLSLGDIQGRLILTR